MKKEFTKNELDKATTTSGITGAVLGSLVVAFVWFMVAFGPDFRSQDDRRQTKDYKFGYYEGESATREKMRGDYYNGWTEAEKAIQKYAAKCGRGEYRVDKVTGVVRFFWK